MFTHEGSMIGVQCQLMICRGHMQFHASLRPPHTTHTVTHTSVHLCQSLYPSAHLHVPPCTFHTSNHISAHPSIYLLTPSHTLHIPLMHLHTYVTLFAPLHTSVCLYTVPCIPLYTLCPPPHTPLSSSLHLHILLHAPL